MKPLSLNSFPLKEKGGYKALCYSGEDQIPPNLPLIRGGINQVSPLNKGGLRKVFSSAFSSKAFTLVELILVITIIAILGTISFITLQGFATDARDVKRISDIRNLLSKLTIEHTKGVSYSELICHTGSIIGCENYSTDSMKTNSGLKILGIQNQTSYQGPVNFENLKENRDSFLDSKTGDDYIFAWAEGGEGENKYSFLQGATINEKLNKTAVVGNYYKGSETDTEGLITDEEGNIIINLPTICDDGDILYGASCVSLGEIPISSCAIAGEMPTTTAKANINCSETDIILCTRNGHGYQISACNLGTNTAGTGSESYGNFFQWGNNYPFPRSGVLPDVGTPNKSTIQVDASGYGPGNYYTSSTFIYSNANWSSVRNDNLWGDTTNTNEARQGPCDDGYHIPTRYEWAGLVYTYLHKKGEKPYFGKNFYSNATFKSIMIEDLKLPAMGWRYWDTANSSGTGGNFGYQSSSPYSDERSGVFYFGSYYIIYQINSYPYAYGWPIRCFKN